MRGFTYLGVLVAIALLGIAQLAVSEVWTTSAARQRAEELDWIGAQFVQAIGSYYQATPGAAKSFPRTLEELLEDRRFVVVRRHLRVVYRNPYTAQADWQLLTGTNGTFAGVRAVFPTGEGIQSRDFVYLPSQDARRL